MHSRLLIVSVVILLTMLIGHVVVGDSLIMIATQIPSTNRLNYLVIYYGWINTSTITNTPADILIVSGNNVTLQNQAIISELREKGSKVFLYIHDGNTPVGLGSSYKDLVVDGGYSVSDWTYYIESLIDRYDGVGDGVFLDEVDPGYFTSDLDPSNPLIQGFETGLRDIIDYAHSLGLEVIVNGVRAYAGYGDYYLWEGWCSTFTGTPDDPLYTYVQDFLQSSTGDSNPLAWVNDVAKLNYLRSNGLLSKTLAVSLGPPIDKAREEVCSVSAAIAGFAAWGYADATYYASATGPAPVYAYPLGQRLTTYVIDTDEGVLRAQFTTGEYAVDVSGDWSIVEKGDLYNPPPMAGSPVTVTVGDAGAGLDIVGLTVLHDGYTLQVEVLLDSSFQGNAIQVYIDSDNNSSTGYTNPGTGVTGADLLIEFIPPSSTIYTYAGDGTSWSWSSLGSAYSVETGPARYLIAPMKKIDAAKLWVVTIDSSWAVADVEPQGGVLVSKSSYASPLYGFRGIINSGTLDGTAVITSSGYTDSITVYAPSGYYSELVYYKPWRPISVSQDTGPGPQPLTFYSSLTDWQDAAGPGVYYGYNSTLGLYKIYIRAGPHQSPVTLSVEYESQPLGQGLRLGNSDTIMQPLGLDGLSVLLAASAVAGAVLVYRLAVRK